MKTSVKVSLGLLGLGLLTTVGFQNCAEPFATKLDGKYASTGFGSSGTGASGGSGQPGQSGPTPTPPPNQFKFTLSNKLFAPVVVAQVDPANAQTIYIADSTGLLLKSVNAGVDWSPLCKATASTSSKFIFSGTNVFLTGTAGLLKVSDLQGGTCITVKTSNSGLNVIASQSGRLFLFEGNSSYSLPTISTSNDAGKTWTPVTSGISATSLYTWYAGPDYMTGSDGVIMLVNYSSSEGPTLYSLTSAGATKLVPVTGAAYYILSKVARDPAGNFAVGGSTSYYSTDAGATFKTMPAFDSMTSTGALLSVVTTNGVSQLLKASAVGKTADPVVTLSAASDSVSVSGSTLSILSARKLSVSVDSGVTVARVGPQILPETLNIQSVVSAGTRVYMASPEVLLRSDDSGKTFNVVQEISSLGITPVIEVNRTNPDVAYLLQDAATTGVVYKTSNGFTSMAVPAGLESLSGFYYGVTLATSGDATAAMVLGGTSNLKYFDSESAFSAKALSNSDKSGYSQYSTQSRLAPLIPGSSSEALVVNASKLLKYSYLTSEFTDVTASTALTNGVLGIYQRPTSTSASKIWVINKMGQIAESNDGVAFTLKFGGALASAASTLQFVSADDAGTSFAAFDRSSANLYTTSNGKWVTTATPGCTITSVAAIGANWVLGCNRAVPRYIAR